MIASEHTVMQNESLVALNLIVATALGNVDFCHLSIHQTLVVIYEELWVI